MIQAQNLMALTIEWSSMRFLGAILIGLPLMASLLFINIGLGVITRAAPALNIFAVGFPAMILAGIILLSLSMTSIGFRIQWLWQESCEIMGTALGLR
jgi:flagellar biosynthetic protein FliR